MSEEQLSSDFHKIQRFAQELKRPDSVITTSSIVSSSDTASQAGDSEGPPSAYTISGLYGLPPGLPGQQSASLMQQQPPSTGAVVAKVVSRRRTHSGSLGLESHGGGHVMSNPNGKYLTWMKKGLWGAKLGSSVKWGAKKWMVIDKSTNPFFQIKRSWPRATVALPLFSHPSLIIGDKRHIQYKLQLPIIRPLLRPQKQPSY